LSMKELLPVYTDVETAHRRISPVIHRTPVMTSTSINKITGLELYFKCENFQKVGAFKFRGASNAVLSLSEDEARKGVATHSSGNHAAALALAAAMRGVPAYIVMPSNAPQVKKTAVAGYGARITYCEPTLQARESTLEAVVKETGATFIHPYNNLMVIAGQGTAVKELMEEVPGLEMLIAPVGGGGLLSGTAITAKAVTGNIKVIAAEPANADDAARSFHSGTLHPSVHPHTICDGLLTSLGSITFPIIRNCVDEILTVKEENIIRAMQLIWERMKIIIEPSSATVLGIILEHPEFFAGKDKRIGLIISGGNVELKSLPF
jgi:threonine dehydratase